MGALRQLALLGLLTLGAAACGAPDAAHDPGDTAPDDVTDADGGADPGDGARSDAGGDAVAATPRPYRLGFTPWPYDLTAAAVDWTWRQIATDGDAYSIHLEEGVPWPEAAAGAPFSADFEATLDAERAALLPGHAVVLSVNALNLARDGLAPYRGDGVNQPLPAPWDAARLDDVAVADAFTAYTERLIDRFDPDWLVLGVEVNLLYRNRPDLWPAYLTLFERVRAALAAAHPELPIGASVFANAYVESYQDAALETVAGQRAALDLLRPSLDFLGLSVYPFMSGHLCDPVDDAYVSAIFSLGEGLPVAVTESGFSAQPWSLDVGGTTLTFAGSAEKQDGFLTRLLAGADDAGAPFVTWFTVRDYDALWEALDEDPTALVWRDTGLFDEAGAPRPAHATWRAALARPLAR